MDKGKNGGKMVSQPHVGPKTAETQNEVGHTCLVNEPPRFIRPDPNLLVCSHNITVDVSL